MQSHRHSHTHFDCIFLLPYSVIEKCVHHITSHIDYIIICESLAVNQRQKNEYTKHQSNCSRRKKESASMDVFIPAHFEIVSFTVCSSLIRYALWQIFDFSYWWQSFFFLFHTPALLCTAYVLDSIHVWALFHTHTHTHRKKRN